MIKPDFELPQGGFWREEDADELDAFLMSEHAGLEWPMGATMIDGFLCALLSGPNLIQPSVAMRWIYDSEHGKQQPVYKNSAQMTKIVGLVMQQWNATASTLTHAPELFEPLFEWRTDETGKDIGIIDEWCWGYMCGVALDKDAWQPLILAQPLLFGELLRYGTEAGIDALMAAEPNPSDHDEAVERLPHQIRTIHAHFFRERTGELPGQSLTPSFAHAFAPDAEPATAPFRREGQKVGRNDPCPCGSQRKYKQCHGAN